MEKKKEERYVVNSTHIMYSISSGVLFTIHKLYCSVQCGMGFEDISTSIIRDSVILPTYQIYILDMGKR